jgi:DNA-binding beta-propeller fold protein YncE
MFLHTDQATYVLDRDGQQMHQWSVSFPFSSTLPVPPFAQSRSLFLVPSNPSIYLPMGHNSHQIIRWNLQPWIVNNLTTVHNGSCWSLFVLPDDTFYCSLRAEHHVVLHNQSTVIRIAGMTMSGNTSTTLNQPLGIYVTEIREIYVADCGNDRVQLFRPNQASASTLVGGNNELVRCPSAVVLDADRRVFVADRDNHRIIVVDGDVVRCIVACRGQGAGADQLLQPIDLALDTNGSLLVLDSGNGRVQKFTLRTNSCGKCLFETIRSLFAFLKNRRTTHRIYRTVPVGMLKHGHLPTSRWWVQDHSPYLSIDRIASSSVHVA